METQEHGRCKEKERKHKVGLKIWERDGQESQALRPHLLHSDLGSFLDPNPQSHLFDLILIYFIELKLEALFLRIC